MNQKTNMKISRDATLMVYERAPEVGGVFYLVKNPKAFAGQSFCGNFDQLMAKRYSALRQYWNVSEEQFLTAIGVVM